MSTIPFRKVIVVSLNVFFTIIFIGIDKSVAQTSVPDIVSGLQAYWKFDEGSDTTAKDISGNHVHGILHSNTGWTSQGKFNNALSIDNGTNGYVDFGTSNLQLTSELTISLWVYRQGNSGSFTEALISRCQYGYPFLIQLQNSGYVSTFFRGSETPGGSYVVSSGHLQNGMWNHIVLTYKSGERIIYINGAMDKVDTVVKGNLYNASGGAPANIRIGASGAVSTPMWGNYDEVRIYNRALSEEEITALYDGTGLDTTPPLPVSTVNDGTGNDMDSTISPNTLSANWTETSDPQSKVVRYYYAIGTTPGGTDIIDWTNNEMSLSVLQRGLSLTIGTTYYTTVVAENSSGLKSTTVSSDGIHVVNIQYSNLVAQDSCYRINNPIDVVNYPQNLPSLSEIVNKPLWSPSAGLYTWRDNWSDWPANNNSFTNEIHQVGWKAIRAGSYYNEMLKDDQMDNLVIAARNDNVKVMFTLIGKQRYETGEFANDQQWIDSFLVFIDSMIGRFGPNGKYFQDYPAEPYEPILYWEIWNEPNLHYMTGAHSTTTTEHRADLYSRLLIAAYNHIRSIPEWDDVKVVAMSATGVSNEVPGFIDLVHSAVQTNGGDPARCYDIVSIHPYTHDCPPDVEDIMTSNGVSINYTFSLINETVKVKENMAKWGNAGKPIWFTEVGWSRTYPNLGHAFAITDHQQAAYVCRLYATAMRLGVAQVHVMFVVNADGHNSGFFNTSGHTWYESAKAAQNFIRLMPVPKIIGAISDGDLGYYAYRINPNVDDPAAEPVVMAWNVLGPMTVNFPVDPSSNYLLLDILGDSVIISPQNGQLEIPIGPYPVYVVKGISVPSYTVIKPPEELKIDSVTTNLVSLSWVASTSSGIAGYAILRDGAVRSTTTGTTFNDTDIGQDTTYSYSVKAYTASNVSSRPSNEVRAKTLRTTDTTVPSQFYIYQNYPNPFNPSTKIDFFTSKKENIKLEIFDMLGRQIRTLVDGIVAAGPQSVSWDGRDAQGKRVSSGVYFYQLKTESGFTKTQKLVLLR
jgi:hypothetical protein